MPEQANRRLPCGNQSATDPQETTGKKKKKLLPQFIENQACIVARSSDQLTFHRWDHAREFQIFGDNLQGW